MQVREKVRRSLVPLFISSLVPLFCSSLVPLFIAIWHFSCKFPYGVALVCVHVDCAGSQNVCLGVLVHSCSAAFHVRWRASHNFSPVAIAMAYSRFNGRVRSTGGTAMARLSQRLDFEYLLPEANVRVNDLKIGAGKLSEIGAMLSHLGSNGASLNSSPLGLK